MNILITTGIFEPQSGGPAIYTPGIAKKLTDAGHVVTVITYSDKSDYDFDNNYSFQLVRVARTSSRVWNYFLFFKAVLKYIKKADFIYTLDWLAAGLPVALATKIYRKKYVVRVGGGYIWEKYLEQDKTPMPLHEFYKQGLYKKYPLLFYLIRFVLNKARFVVFNSQIQADLFINHYKLEKNKVSVIENPISVIDNEQCNRSVISKEIIFCGRLIVMKNVASLIYAFKEADLPDYKLTIIGDGPRKNKIKQLIKKLNLEEKVTVEKAFRQRDLYQRICNCYLVVIPSWTDISPNQVYELLAYGIPFILTKENYLSVRDKIPVTIDPYSSVDIANKLSQLTDSSSYEKLVSDLSGINYCNTWDDVLDQHLKLFGKI